MQFGPDLDWLKRVMPRGLYGRAVLILLLPVFTLVLVVTVMFLQRHFEDVTRQMTRSVAREIGFVAQSLDGGPTRDAAQQEATYVARNLDLQLDVPGEPVSDSRVFYDVSGRIVADELRDQLPGLRAVELGDLDRVRLGMLGTDGSYTLSFKRERVSASNPHQLLVLLGFTAALMTVIAGLFLRNQLRPIKRLAQAADSYGKGRLIPYRPGGAVEIRSAGAAFLDMRNRLERLAEQRGMMLTGISHDLRTPLTRLQLSLSMLSPEIEPDEGEIAAMRRDVEEMSAMVNAFLAYARDVAQDGEAETVALLPFVQRIIEDAGRAGHRIALHAPGVSPSDRATFRPDMLRRAIENLIGNAVRYGDETRIELGLTRRALRIAVEDDGPGIPEDRHEEALRPFSRLDPGRSRNRGEGAGLGLAIAADAARHLGGQLRLTRSADLGGLRAEIAFPR
ncbi:two-component system, OmpR family, osmolarity sensor histidine kinase EnvZ [Paracoccus isoporae]|uniref:histidine kinase n=1 Tax=Paracoccus isoporae TaxID=591205 RepID=A0A1G7H7B1_9RHOB|nr:ATP-binding protein [Paracoccus isoporae]SDE96213.1 two-component system, OmpR family, osmolarity sensor histidine kinase EnvZ [Paracoccus isoporae]